VDQVPNILVVDDEPMIRQFVAAALSHKGFSVLTAANGEEAIAVSNLHSGDLLMVITDVKMPIMDGPALIRLLSADIPGIPVLFMSAYYNAADLEQFKNSEFLSKPFSVDKLLAGVHALLRMPV
jgi:two-component system cell cycle sensor histidine kinase/response regulator CckA